MIVTPYDLSFRKEQEGAVLCKKELTKKEVEQFKKVCCQQWPMEAVYFLGSR